MSYASIKVYLSAVRSLHIDNGFSDPLVNCLQLQRLLRCIKRVQGSPTPSRLPITMELMRVLQKALDLNNADHVMLWAACCVGFFGFLRVAEFTVNSTFDPEIHLSVGDLQVDCLLNPSCLKINIKCSKPDPFRCGCGIYLGKGNSHVCPLRPLAVTCMCVAMALDRCPLSEMEDLYRAKFWPSKSNTSCALLVIPDLLWAVFRIGAATTAASCGVPDHLIITLGRWSSDAYQVYIRTPITSIVQVTKSYCSRRYVTVNWPVGCPQVSFGRWGCGF